jgi:DNA-binding NarL/FixJ family response regulator
MPVVWLLCPDAGLRERLQRCLRDGAGLEVRLKPCACDAVVVAEPVWTPAQVETLQAYVDTGSVSGAARQRCCSEQTIRRHLANARRRVGAQNVAQLVYIACAAGVLTPVYTNKLVTKMAKIGY